MYGRNGPTVGDAAIAANSTVVNWILSKSDSQACTEHVTRLGQKLARLNDTVRDLREKFRS